MIFSNKILAPCIYLYQDATKFSQNILDICSQDFKNWNIGNQSNQNDVKNFSAKYDQYSVGFDFSVNEKFLLMSKNIWDCVSDYSDKNLTFIQGFDSCIIRRYLPKPGFFTLESSDIEKPSRKITSILFLSQVNDGGQVFFKNFDLSVNPDPGCLLVFPASFAYSFKINKPKESESLVVVSHFV